MIARLSTLALALLLATQADTLRLRSGATVTGSWLGGTADEVRFMVDDQVQKYPRANVVEVDFTSDGMANQVTTPIAPPPPAVIEPNIIGVPFLRGASGLLSLEREYGMLVRNNTMYGMGGGTVYRIQGPQSPVRVRQGDKLVFVVRLNAGGDPRRFQLYALESRMNYRQSQPTFGGRPPALPVTIAKISDSSYEIAPTRPLYPGEYAISSINSNDSYCFGVDY
jgi:hypothetical protein